MRVNPSYYTYYRTVNTGPGISVAPSNPTGDAPRIGPTETLVASKPRTIPNSTGSNINTTSTSSTSNINTGPTGGTPPANPIANYGLADFINNKLATYKNNQSSGNTYINSSLNNNDWGSLYNQFSQLRQSNMGNSAEDQDKIFTDWFNKGKSGGWW